MAKQLKAIESKHFRRVMGKFATGVTVITFDYDGEPAGMTANAFMSLSMDPPMVLVSIRNQSRFANSVKEGTGFGISFLREEHEEVSSHFGGRPNPELKPKIQHWNDVPVLNGALVQLAVRANSIYPGGDHLIYTADVEGIEESDGHPLLFFSGRYKQLNALNPVDCWFNVD